MATCVSERDKTETTFLAFTRTLLKSFVLLVVVCMTISLKNRLITPDTTLFYMALFVIGTTVLFAIVGIIDSYVFSNLILGIGLALGLQLMDWRSAVNSASQNITNAL
jgi:hypothetical protein